MKRTLSLLVLAIASLGSARADLAAPLASHRAAYEISLAATDGGRPPNAETPVSASGLIAYEFRGSSCEGYASNFRQLTQLQRNEGDPISSDIRSLTFEDADGKSMRFQINSTSAGNSEAPVAGSAARGEGGAISVDLTKPTKESLKIGNDILFPTQHIEHIIAKAKE